MKTKMRMTDERRSRLQPLEKPSLQLSNDVKASANSASSCLVLAPSSINTRCCVFSPLPYLPQSRGHRRRLLAALTLYIPPLHFNPIGVQKWRFAFNQISLCSQGRKPESDRTPLASPPAPFTGITKTAGSKNLRQSLPTLSPVRFLALSLILAVVQCLIVRMCWQNTIPTPCQPS
jgi:hypothetical protein